MATIDQISARARQALFARLPQSDDVLPRISVGDAACHVKTSGDLKANFLATAAANKFQVHSCTQAELLNTVNSLLSQHAVKSLLCSADLPFALSELNGVEPLVFDRPLEEMREQVFGADAALCVGTAGASSSGNVLCASSPQAPRCLTLVPPILVLLLPESRLVASPEAAINLALESGAHPANLVFTAGPARTADIELITIFGAHGPHTVELVVYKEE